MSVPKKIRRFWMWVGIAMLIELAAFTLWKRWYWFFPSHAVSEVYTRYAGTEGLNVVFFKDFKINDTVSVDVTYIEATTDSAWLMLQDDFNTPKIPEGYRELFDKTQTVDLWLTAKNAPKIRIDTDTISHDIIILSRKLHVICVFHTENSHQTDAIIERKIHNLSISNSSKK